MLLNDFDPQVASDPDYLVVCGGQCKAARQWAAVEVILEWLRNYGPDQTLLGQPAVFR